jgi:putative transcriptional regulator
MVVRNRLKKIRHQLEIDHVEDMAKLLGIAKGQYCRFENQKAQPSLETILKVSKILNRSVEQIVYLDETPE